MLPIEQISPFIRHEDPLVVDLAMKCLQKVRLPERVNGDFILDAVEQGQAKVGDFLAHFEPTARVMAYALQCLQSSSSSKLPVYVLHPLVLHAPDQLLTPSLIAAAQNLKPAFDWMPSALPDRLMMISVPTADLQERFLAACGAATHDGTAMSEQAELRALVSALASRLEARHWALEQYQLVLRHGGWKEIWLLRLLTEMGERSAFEAALSRFPEVGYDDSEAHFEELTNTLAELCQPADLPQLAGLWETSDAGNCLPCHP